VWFDGFIGSNPLGSGHYIHSEYPATCRSQSDAVVRYGTGARRDRERAGTPDLDTVRVLRQAGLTDAAMSELRRWVQKNPEAAIPTDIKELLASLDDNALDVARASRDAGNKNGVSHQILTAKR
jgi:hypothetical protein